MTCSFEVLGGMAILGGVATSHMPAGKACSQMHPAIAEGNAFRANVSLRRNVMAVSKVFA